MNVPAAVLLAVSLTACQIPHRTVTQEIRSRWAEPVKRDANLYRIDDKLYRSEQPVAADIPVLYKSGIQTVVNLRFFGRDDDRRQIGKSGLTLINYPLLSWHITPKQIAEVLYIIEMRQQNGAVLVHCYHGADRTGLVSGMYRIIYQGRSIRDARDEMVKGPFGYHGIWINIAKLFSEEKVAEVRRHLQTLRRQNR
ncbi:phosphatase domain-containing putative toxin [Neisseria chenwenguii]|uniref:phosphatase domain-containing putative toxin n=1 Tax=Neisseria chenwenguii TaxID=1853278 RepID=UPI000F4E736C|nr:tyrosine-protein phosphatase [Neisseria chenwenguii]ROV56549.1 protein-tyrosine-phosphatase [Neisseria chenwenguii]